MSHEMDSRRFHRISIQNSRRRPWPQSRRQTILGKQSLTLEVLERLRPRGFFSRFSVEVDPSMTNVTRVFNFFDLLSQEESYIPVSGTLRFTKAFQLRPLAAG